jgi:lysophospholipase L1-like esterase
LRRLRPIALLLLAPLAFACGGGTPSGPSTPTPTPGFPVSGFVFYDENGNGTLDPSETVRLPGVAIAVGGQTAQTSTGGRFTASDVPSGAQSATARQETLPTYFRPGPPVSVAVPPSGDVAVPAVLDLDSRLRANTYIAFGDSITVGEGSSGGGYRDQLQADLRAYWGKATVFDEGQSGTKSEVGAGRIGASLAVRRPAYALILYGTNDWNLADCRANPPCETVENLRFMIAVTRGDWGAHPIVGTLPPVNPAYVDRNAAERNEWVSTMNGFIRTMAQQEHVAIAEVYRAFPSQQSSWPGLFFDDKHPNDAGYQLISRAFFDAITRPYSTSTSARRHGLLLRPF